MQLRKRLVCHYCGQKSNKSKLDGDRFECEKCDSVNIYDQNGEIVDVPPNETGDAHRYASSLAPFQSNDIFCATCVKNQYLYTSALSEFLPDPEDPKYDEIEAALPKFKKHLEERYPQCCARCEPRVRTQLEQATYNARSDHMRRMLEKSRARRVASRLGWRRLLVSGAGVGYVVSTTVQVIWHAMGLVVKDDSPINKATDCFWKPMPTGCPDLVKPYIGWSLLITLVCIWWNPKWQFKIGEFDGRLVGLGKYYQLQLALLAIRFGTWMCLVDFPPAQVYQEMLHTLSFTIIAVMTGWAMITVKVDKTPLVNWEYEQPELVSEKQFVPPSSKVRPTFNISALAPTTEPDLRAWHPPTPPLENDEMDWTPSQHFDPPKQPRFRHTGPTPFHGTLPALSGNARKQETKQAIGLPPGHFDKRDKLPVKKEAASFMAEPKFFPRNSDTGLENIFGQVFSLHEPASMPTPPSPGPTATSQRIAPEIHLVQPLPAPRSSMLSLLSASLLIMALVMWSIGASLDVAVPNLRAYVIGAVLMLYVLRLLMDSTAASIRIFLFVETLVLAALGAQLASKDRIMDDICTKLGAGLLALLILQEMYLLVENREERVPSQGGAPMEGTVYENQIGRGTRRDSVESIMSDASMATTSTASGWQTPRVNRFSGTDLTISGSGTGIVRPRRHLPPR